MPTSRSVADLRVFRILIALLTVIAALVLISMLWQVISHFTHTLLLLLFAGLLAFVLSPAVNALEHRGVPRTLAVLGIYLLVLGAIAIGVALAVGPLTSQLTNISTHLPSYISSLNSGKSSTPLDKVLIKLHLPFRTAQLERQALTYAQHLTSNLLSDAIGLLTTLASFVVDLVVVLVMSIYLLIDSRRIHGNLMRIVPERYRNRAFFLEAAVYRVLGGYIRGQLLMALLVGVLYGAGCFILGVHYPLVIGILAGLFELIPMIGPVLGAIPALGIALSQSFTLAIWVLVLYIVIQQLESHIIGPRITGNAVGLHPLGAILAITAAVEVSGLLGALLGVPAVGLIYVLLVAIYWEHTGAPVVQRRGARWRPRLFWRGTPTQSEPARDPVATATEAVANAAGDATPQPQALAEIEGKAADLRITFERAEVDRLQEQQAAQDATRREATAIGSEEESVWHDPETDQRVPIDAASH